MSRRLLRGCALLALLVIGGCGGSKSSSSTASTGPTVSDGTASQVATSQVTAAANMEDGGSGVAFAWPREQPSLITRLGRALSWERPALAAATTYSCTSTNWFVISVTEETYQPPGCTITWPNGNPGGMTWTGYWLLTYSSASCPTPNLVGGTTQTHAPGLFGATAPCSVSHATNGVSNSVSPGTITRSFTGPPGNTLAVTWDTNTPSGYANKISGPIDVSCGSTCPSSTGGSSGSRSIAIGGTHLTATVNGTTTLWDHTVNTTTALTVKGSGTSRSVTGGVVVVQHNLAKFTSTTTINPDSTHALTYSSNCMFPTGGEMTTTFSGTRFDSETETIAFGPNCGDATITFTNGGTSIVTLTN